MTSDVPEGAEIFADWSLYDKVIHFNYMQHREMAQVIRATAAQVSHPLHVLDLGCGDGRMAGEGLRQSSVASYVGIDLSQAALESARKNLSQLGGSIQLKHADLAAALHDSLNPAPNLLLASYSLHHYRGPEVVDCIRHLAKTLAPGGVFLWIDLELEEQESREDFLNRFHEQQLRDWNAFDAGEIQEIIDHMAESDFPLTDKEKRQLTAAVGLRWISTPYQDGNYAAHCYAKSV